MEPVHLNKFPPPPHDLGIWWPREVEERYLDWILARSALIEETCVAKKAVQME